MNAQLLVVTQTVLENFSNTDLAALNTQVGFYGNMAKGCPGYAQAFETGLIKESGEPADLDTLREACRLEVVRRDEAGTFQ
ncbi:MAG: hypothetical protein V4467_00875 [Patescibacteria group bacterium]